MPAPRKKDGNNPFLIFNTIKTMLPPAQIIKKIATALIILLFFFFII